MTQTHNPLTGLPGGTPVCRVLGGDDEAIAEVTASMWCLGPGVLSLYGNVYVNTDEEGYYRTLVLPAPS